MNENRRRAIVWDTIERIAFKPATDDDQRTWLGAYARTLHTIWDMEPAWTFLALDDHFDVPFLMLNCIYSIDSVPYSISLVQASTTPHCYWQNHIDTGYLSKASLFPASGQYPCQQFAQLRRDIEAVLNGMILHPRCHSHLEDLGVQNVQLDGSIGGLSSHEARIGGGIENPFVLLFHLRYQFCLVSDQARQTERQRLIELFENAIRNSDSTVNARDLFGFQRRNN
jgi:hypothetical protein